MGRKSEKWDNKTKALWAGKVLDGETTIDAVRKQLKAASYQVAAWVGLEAERRIQSGTLIKSRVGLTTAASTVTAEQIEGMVEEKAANLAGAGPLSAAEREALATYMGALASRLRS